MGAEARWALVFAGYLAVQALLRLAIGPALELDEAEAFLHARDLAWGYGPQPPLYFWLQWGAFRLLGEGLPALAALKAALLAGTLLVLLRLLSREARPAAGVAALALGLLPQVAWEGQRALTHSVLALFLAVVAAAAFARALGTGRWRDHLALGLALGLGLLSKFNFAVWALGLLLGALALPEWRRALRWRRLVAAVAVAATVVAPAGLWILRNPALGTGSAAKLSVEGGGLAARVEGMAALIGAGLGFLALGGVVLGAARLAVGRAHPLPPVARLLLAASLASLMLVALGMLASGATAMRERWLLPFLWALPPVGVVALWPRLGARGRRGLALAAALPWLVAMAGLPYASLVDPGYRGADFGPLVAAARRAALPVVATDQWVAGNLAFAAPDLAVTWAADGAGQGTHALVAQDAETPPDGTEVVVPMAREALRLRIVRVEAP